jgi:uncharacterized protein YkwD
MKVPVSNPLHPSPARPAGHATYQRLLLVALALLVVSTAFPASTGSTAPASQTTHEIFLPFLVKSPGAPLPPPPGDWLGYVNFYRETAYLHPLTENPDWNAGGWLHARYIVKNDILKHSENPNNPWYTPAGAAAAEASNLFGSFNPEEALEWTIDGWMQAPFHALGILNPALYETGYGLYTEADGGLAAGAALDVIRGLDSPPANQDYPILWPGDNTIIGLTLHWGGTPDPLTSCPGYTAPAGLPLLIQAGPGDLTPTVTAHDFRAGALPLEHCIFTETTYINPDPAQQSLGRGIMAGRDAIVLIPRQPLTPGTHYTASLTIDGVTHSWTFQVASTPASNRLLPAGEIH